MGLKLLIFPIKINEHSLFFKDNGDPRECYGEEGGRGFMFKRHVKN